MRPCLILNDPNRCQPSQVRLLNQFDSECSLDGPSVMRSIHEWYEMN